MEMLLIAFAGLLAVGLGVWFSDHEVHDAITHGVHVEPHRE